MTLTALLAGDQPSQPPVYVVPAPPAAAELTAAETAGWSIARIGPVASKAEALTALAQAMAFPAYFGRNLDALVDCLRDVAGPTVLVWDGWSLLTQADPGAGRAIAEILRARAAGGGFAAVLVARPDADPARVGQ